MSVRSDLAVGNKIANLTSILKRESSKKKKGSEAASDEASVEIPQIFEEYKENPTFMNRIKKGKSASIYGRKNDHGLSL